MLLLVFLEPLAEPGEPAVKKPRNGRLAAPHVFGDVGQLRCDVVQHGQQLRGLQRGPCTGPRGGGTVDRVGQHALLAVVDDQLDRTSALTGESWRTLLQGLRTKIFLTLSDDFSAQMAAELCGNVHRLKPSYTLSEAGQDARVSLVTGRPAAHRTTVSATKTYRPQREYLFEPKVFTELQNAQAIVLAYDGLNPQPPTYCYLKPHYLDVQTSYFDHRAAGAI